MYVVGVFTSFTLSQAGMVKRWRRLKPAGWKRNAVLNGFGTFATGLVLVIVTVTKFNPPWGSQKQKVGAWIIVVMVPLIVLMFRTIHRHYLSVGRQLRLPEEPHLRPVGTRAIVLAARVDEVTMRAVGYARAMRPLSVRAMHVGRGSEAEVVRKAWDERRLPLPLDIVPGDAHDLVDPVRDYVRALEVGGDEFITVVLPELYRGTGMRQYLHSRRTLILKTAMLFERRVVVTDIPMLESENWAETRGPVMPTRTIAVVLVSAVHNGTLRALEYARALSPTDLRAVIFNVEPEETQRVLDAWGREVRDVSLEAIDSPYREVTRPLVKYAREIHQRNQDALVSVIIPEFVVKRFWHQILHNQTALLIKQALLFEPGVVVTSVPYHLD
jgi:hypothetical protein